MNSVPYGELIFDACSCRLVRPRVISVAVEIDNLRKIKVEEKMKMKKRGALAGPRKA